MTAVTGANVVFLAKNTAIADPAGQSVVTGAPAVLTPVAGSLTAPANGAGVGTPGQSFKGRYMLVRMVPTANSVVTFRASPSGGTPASQSAAGTVVVTLTGTAPQFIQLELSRVLQSDGTVVGDVTGTGPVAFTVLNLSKSA